MKSLKTHAFFFLSFVIFSTGLLAQAPLSFNYQAVLRDDAGQVMASEEMDVEITIIKADAEGSAVFSETHQTQTNEFGLINLQIGSVNSLEDVEWGIDEYFIEVSVNGDPMGISQLLSVPYALHSRTSEDAFSGDYEDLENKPDLEGFPYIEEPQVGDMVYYSENGWQAIPVGQDSQFLALENGIPQWADLPECDCCDNGDDNGDEPGTVSDIDGNVYNTIIIDDVEWMAENLRTTRYADGTQIPTDLNDDDWNSTTEGAYAIFPSYLVDGIDSDEEMVEAYGKLYNWYALNDERGLCPAGWHVPSLEDWNDMVDYIIDNYDFIENNVGNSLKSCRQINSPLGGDCDTEEHPRWEEHSVHYGTDDFGFSALPAGRRSWTGTFGTLETFGRFWTSTSEWEEEDSVRAHYLLFHYMYGDIDGLDGFLIYRKRSGISVRCIKDN